MTPLFSMSFVMLSFQVMLGRPLLREPSGIQLSACFARQYCDKILLRWSAGFQKGSNHHCINNLCLVKFKHCPVAQAVILTVSYRLLHYLENELGHYMATSHQECHQNSPFVWHRKVCRGLQLGRGPTHTIHSQAHQYNRCNNTNHHSIKHTDT